MDEIDLLLQSAALVLHAVNLPASGWHATLLSRRDDEVMYRLVVRIEQPRCAPLAVKRIFRPIKPQQFAKTIERHTTVAASLPEVPKILGHDPESQTIVMELARGDTLFDIFSRTKPAGHAHALTIAGRWVERFHRSEPWEPRVFKPVYATEHLETLKDRADKGELQLPGMARFRALLEHVLANVPGPEACQTVAAVGHGDLNLRNILIDGDTATGLDFGSPGLLPVCHDLARLFCHYGTLCAKPGNHGHGPLPGIDLRAFFEGYTLTGADDQTIAFMCKVRILRDWQTIPKRATSRTLNQQLRFQGIHRLAKRMLA
ncbi:phosphotransferase family protein [Vannielia sp. SX4]|uniref:phosphotransferase family protein n=1 Tax=Vannielia sp. SX4 TaxID=3463852 RepID=UPI004058B0BB